MGIRYYVAMRNMRPKGLVSKHIHRLNACGQTLVEYALIIAFISVVAIASLFTLGGRVSGVFTTVTSQLGQAEIAGQSVAPHH